MRIALGVLGHMGWVGQGGAQPTAAMREAAAATICPPAPRRRVDPGGEVGTGMVSTPE